MRSFLKEIAIFLGELACITVVSVIISGIFFLLFKE